MSMCESICHTTPSATDSPSLQRLCLSPPNLLWNPNLRCDCCDITGVEFTVKDGVLTMIVSRVQVKDLPNKSRGSTRWRRMPCGGNGTHDCWMLRLRHAKIRGRRGFR
ncbi:unnamed protein product [Arabis nemorensis]|uniref:SHSP domain-containing protein n=1 Tax=Arabis nemorensis TaxID=586526 RepID=A0A565B9Y7_9BRAS|nr:unnamed protein product [Arabis nemorensis]